MEGRWSSWMEGDRPLGSKGEAREWMGGRALLASEMRLSEGAPKAWAKDGSDWGGCVAMLLRREQTERIRGGELERGEEGGRSGGAHAGRDEEAGGLSKTLDSGQSSWQEERERVKQSITRTTLFVDQPPDTTRPRHPPSPSQHASLLFIPAAYNPPMISVPPLIPTQLSSHAQLCSTDPRNQ